MVDAMNKILGGAMRPRGFTLSLVFGMSFCLWSSATAFNADPDQPFISDSNLPPPLVNPFPPSAPERAVRILAAGLTVEERVVEIVNQERWTNGGLPPLKKNGLLDTSSEMHSTNMGVEDFFAHCDLDTKTSPGDRMTAAGYQWNSYAENIAVGYGTPEAVMDGWMNSSGHRANILSTSFREIGVGYYYDSSDTSNVRRDQYPAPPDYPDCVADGTISAMYHYWTQNFGRRSNVYPIVINREAYKTQNPLVNLYIYGLEWGATQMRLRNENGAFGAWEPFSTTRSWQLSASNGVKEVFVELQNGTGTLPITSDTILLEGQVVVPPPIPPATLSASDGLYTDMIRISWTAVPTATRYELYRATSLAGQKTKIMDGPAATFDDTTAILETVHYYWVKACNSGGCSALSSPDTGYLKPPNALPAIMELLFD